MTEQVGESIPEALSTFAAPVAMEPEIDEPLTLEDATSGGSLVLLPSGGVNFSVLEPIEDSAKPGPSGPVKSAAAEGGSAADAEEPVRRASQENRAVLGQVKQASGLTVTKASRYLGDQGTRVEFELPFKASDQRMGGGPLAKAFLAAVPDDGSRRRVRFRGFVESGLPNVMEGHLYVQASAKAIEAALAAIGATGGYRQAIALSHLGDATYTSPFQPNAKPRAGSEPDHVVSVTLLAARGLVCKEAAHKVVLSGGAALGDPYVVALNCGNKATEKRSSTKYKTINPDWADEVKRIHVFCSGTCSLPC